MCKPFKGNTYYKPRGKNHNKSIKSAPVVQISGNRINTEMLY